MAKFRDYRLRPAFQPLERRSALSYQRQTHRRQADVAMLGVCQPYARQMSLTCAISAIAPRLLHAMCLRSLATLLTLHVRRYFPWLQRNRSLARGCLPHGRSARGLKQTVRHDPLSRAPLAKGEGSRQAFFDCDITVDRNVSRPK